MSKMGRNNEEKESKQLLRVAECEKRTYREKVDRERKVKMVPMDVQEGQKWKRRERSGQRVGGGNEAER